MITTIGIKIKGGLNGKHYTNGRVEFINGVSVEYSFDLINDDLKFNVSSIINVGSVNPMEVADAKKDRYLAVVLLKKKMINSAVYFSAFSHDS